MVVGQCFADDQRLRADLHRAVATDQPLLVTRWPGSYLALLILDDELFAFTDLAGQYPLYYRSSGGRTVVGTQAKATAREAGLAGEPDLLALAAQVVCPAVAMLTDDRSTIAGLSRVGGGYALRVKANGHCNTWLPEPPAPMPEMSFADAADALRAALDNAVRRRVDSTPHLTADLSGGVDSTSVAFLAARHRSHPIPVFTYHQPDAPAGDLAFARRYADLDTRLRSNLVSGGPGTLTYQHLDDVGATDIPDPAAVVRSRTRTLLRQVAATGSGVHLGGEGADALLVAPPGYLADLARHGALRRLRRDCRELARLRRVSPASVLTRSTRLAMTSIDRALRLLANRLEKPVDRCTGWLDAIAWWPLPGAEGAWLTPRMRRDLAELVRSKIGVSTPETRLGVGDLAALGEVRVAGAVQRQLSEDGRRFGVWPQTPFLDDDVVRACLTLPAWRRADPRVYKPLLRSALAELVPAPVLERGTKGNYSAEDFRGARLASADLRRRIAELTLADLGVVDQRALQASVSRALDGLPTPFGAFNRLLGAELWLRSIGRAGR